ncbi:hypothetical protein J2X66_003458 [Pseudomonas sp. 3296]|nr:hypothetical protein [Pseudomonas sp. 3296]
MFTIIETEIFKRHAESIWDDGERHEFITWLAANPLAGDVVPGSGGLRKFVGPVAGWANEVVHVSFTTTRFQKALSGC